MDMDLEEEQQSLAQIIDPYFMGKFVSKRLCRRLLFLDLH